MAPHIVAAEGNQKKALALYRWSAELGASVQETLGVTEVLVRNAMDERLQKWNRKETGNPSWLLEDPAAPLRSLTRDKRKDALRRTKLTAEQRPKQHPRYGAKVTHDNVLSQLMFGVWKEILPNHAPAAAPEKQENLNRMCMWDEVLKAAFPYAKDPDGKKTYWRVAHIHLLRNRVAHVDSLLQVDVLDVINDAFLLVGSIDPVLRQRLTGVSTVKQVYSARPK